MRWITIWFLLFGGTSVLAQPTVFEKRLANGFTIYVVENHDQPTAYGAVAVRAGSKNDPADATGMAHYLEHMLFKGTTKMGTVDYEKEKVWLDSITYYYDQLGQTKDEKKRLQIQLRINNCSVKAAEYAVPNEIDKMLAEIGATGVNAYTTVESTVYHNSFPANQLERWMEIYAHRFRDPVFRLFQSELETVYEEKNRKADDMGSSIFEYYLSKFFKYHPYGQQTTIGTTEHLKSPSLRKMYEYFNTYYVANNMALIISGDVDHTEVFRIAETKFGSMRTGEVPPLTVKAEEAFNGREFIRISQTPLPAGVVGFRIPGNTHPDIPALNIVADLLSNSSSSGSIDKIVNDGKIMLGGLEYMPYNDGGAAFLYFVPKPIIQRVKKAEKIVRACINDVCEGKFTDEQLLAVKTNYIKQLNLSYESNSGAAGGVINAYIKGISPAEFFQEAKVVEALTREDIMRVAKTYFGKNCLAMYSWFGSTKKDKLTKPPFKPVAPNKKARSSYYDEWKKIPERVMQPKFVEINEEIDSVGIAANMYMLRNKNQYNNIASMNLIFGTGKHYDQLLEYTAIYLNHCGTVKTPLHMFNQQLAALGCTFMVDVSAHQFSFRLSFPEENIEKVLALVSELLQYPSMEKKHAKQVVKDKRRDFQFNKRSAEYYSDALESYAIYGKNSPYLDKMGLKQFKRTSLKNIKASIEKVRSASLKIFFTGNLSNERIVGALKQSGLVIERKNPSPMYVPEKVIPVSNEVYLLNLRKARQSQINLIKIGDVYKKEDTYVINAFNKYFGGDMSSLMFQEIREFRSLAYATSAAYSIPAVQGSKCIFMAYAGTQSDKANDCVEAMFDLVNNMPVQPERMETVKSGLVKMAAASRPSFRGMIATIETWKRRGYDADPAKYHLLKYPLLKFEDIETFYTNSVKAKPTLTCIAGKTKAMDQTKLKQYGKIRRFKKKQLVKK